MLVGSIFLVNLFVGVICMKFNEAQKSENSSNILLTEDQQKWIDFQRMIVGVKAEFQANHAPTNKLRLLCFKLMRSQPFDLFIMLCIVLNILTMAILYEGSTDAYNNTLETINLGFTSVFIFELIIKLISTGPVGFWINSWN
jgi:hypothetical protein